MRAYTVIGTSAVFAAGALLALSAEQVARRAHAVRGADLDDEALDGFEIPKDLGDLVLVEVEKAVEFKCGEVIVVVNERMVSPRVLQAIAPNDSTAAKTARDAAADRLAHGKAVKEAAAKKRRAEQELRQERRKKGAGGKKDAEKEKGKAAKDSKPAPAPAGTAETETAADAAHDARKLEPAGEIPPNLEPEGGSLV